MKDTNVSLESDPIIEAVSVNQVTYKTAKIQGLDIFYREAGDPENPTLLLLHGYPTSSHMFRNLMVLLGNKYHLIAPDYPGYGNSSMPKVTEFEYTFDHIADVIDELTNQLNLQRFTIYMQDYGAPVGFRLALKHPDRIQGIISQNGNAYEAGLSPFWENLKAYWREPENPDYAQKIKGLMTAEGTKSQYVDDAKNPEKVSPDNWLIDQALLDRPGNKEIQMAMFYSYRTNVASYPKWQEYLRHHQPKVLIVWGKRDPIFPASGAEAFKKDVEDIDFHLLDAGHFALEEKCDEIAELIDQFMTKNNLQ